MIKRCAAVLLGLMSLSAPLPLDAQEFSGLARLELEGSGLSDSRRGIEITLRLSQGVPYRVFTLDEPERLVLDFREVDWSGVDPALLDQSERVRDVRVGGFRPGWSRMVVDMDGPYVLETADLSLAHESGGVVLRLMMTPAEPEVFAQNSGHPGTPGWDRHDSEPQSVVTPDNGPLRILLDPGHGGIDPGADQGGVLEKDLMLLFAIELRDL